jgi:hypothetical protein
MSNSGAVPRILNRGGRVYDHEGGVHQPAQTDILIAGEMIERLGQNLPAGDGTEVIDAAGKLVLPGAGGSAGSRPQARVRLRSEGQGRPRLHC